MEKLVLTLREVDKIKKLIEALKADLFFDASHATPNYYLLKKVNMYVHRLPVRVLDFLNNFKYEENGEGVCLLKGFEIDEQKIRATPLHWSNSEADERTVEEEILLMLCSAVLGDAIGWKTQQSGKIVHNIVPVQGDEHKQVGSSTLTELWWHTEEAFHPCRCDYLSLLCLRNNEEVATTFASINSLNITLKDKEVLFGENYFIYPDQSHLPNTEVHNGSYAGVVEMKESPKRVPILFGDFNHPYLCIDPYYMSTSTYSDTGEQALKNIIQEINQNLKSVVMEPGDMLFLDNYRVVHGRDAFKTNFDGTSRWLKRLNTVRDLRKSRALRKDYQSRIIEIL